MLVLGHDHAGDLFAQTIWQADDAQFLDERRGVVSLFDFVRVNILAARIDDDLFRATDEIKIAFVVELAYVAGVQPAVDERASRRVFILKVADHHVWPARDNLTDAEGVGVEDFYFHTGQWLTDRPGRELVLRACDGQDGRGFR